MQQIGERNNAHQERAIVTWNGFVALAIGLLLLAAGIWQLLRGMPYSGPPSRRAWSPRYSPLSCCSCSAS